MNFFSAADIFHWSSPVQGGSWLRNILFMTAFVARVAEHFLRCRSKEVLLLNNSLKLQLQQAGKLPIRDIFTLPSQQVLRRHL